MHPIDMNPCASETSDLELSNAQGFESISLTVASECSIENPTFWEFPGIVTKNIKNTKSKQFCALKPRYIRDQAKMFFQSKCVRRFRSCNVRYIDAGF